MYFDEIGSDTNKAVMLAPALGFKLPAKPFSKRFWHLKSLTVGGGYQAINHQVKADKDYTRAMTYFDHTAYVCVPAMEYLGGATLVAGQFMAGFALLLYLFFLKESPPFRYQQVFLLAVWNIKLLLFYQLISATNCSLKTSQY